VDQWGSPSIPHVAGGVHLTHASNPRKRRVTTACPKAARLDMGGYRTSSDVTRMFAGPGPRARIRMLIRSGMTVWLPQQCSGRARSA
jgi:hypothetical protein